jgi:hypothetical protein
VHFLRAAKDRLMTDLQEAERACLAELDEEEATIASAASAVELRVIATRLVMRLRTAYSRQFTQLRTAEQLVALAREGIDMARRELGQQAPREPARPVLRAVQTDKPEDGDG